MENYKVKLSLLNENSQEQGSMIVSISDIEEIKNLHNVSLLDDTFEQLKKELEKNSN